MTNPVFDFEAGVILETGLAKNHEHAAEVDCHRDKSFLQVILLATGPGVKITGPR
jgi:hypothetical protein